MIPSTAAVLFAFVFLIPNALAAPAQTEEIPTASAAEDTRGEVIPEAKPEPSPEAAPELFRNYGVTLSAQIPHPLFLDIEKRFSKTFDLSLGAGGLNLKLHSGAIPVEVGIGAIDLRSRWHPFSGGFFLGAALGIQTLSAQSSNSIPVKDYGTIDLDVSLKIHSPYFTPHLGWIWYFNSGFILGFDFGWQIPFAVKTELLLSSPQPLTQQVINLLQQTQEYKNLDLEIQKAGNQIGRISLPYIAVLRLGWSF